MFSSGNGAIHMEESGRQLVEEGGQNKLKQRQITLYKRGKSVINLYSKCGAESLVMGGQPLDEVVYSYGPFVMNTEEQIRQCINKYNSGKMGNPELVN